MAEDKAEPRETNWRQLLPWIDLFQGFRVAMDLNKLLLAAAGILVMAFGWWLLAVLFHTHKPEWSDYQSRASTETLAGKWSEFKIDREHWNLRHETAGSEDDNELIEPEDIAADVDEFNALQKANDKVNEELKSKSAKDRASFIDQQVKEGKLAPDEAKTLLKLGVKKPAGRLRTWPWFEERGPNPFLLVSGQSGRQWEPGHFWDWLLTQQIPVLIEPLVKFLLPVRYFFKPTAGPMNKFYFLLVTIWTLLTWSFFGGAITRIAAVQITRQEKTGWMEALRFTCKRYLSYVTAPLFPMAFMLALVVVMVLYGFIHMIPVLGELVDALLWWLPVALGLLMAVLLVGLVSWPMMAAAVSTEGTDSWEAVSRSYSYLIQAPWHFVWYNIVALAYGAVIIFFVGFMGSLMVYLADWGVSQTPLIQTAGREPSYLFVYAPTSFGWRELLLQGVKVNDGAKVIAVVDHGEINASAYELYVNGPNGMGIVKKTGAAVVSCVWLYLIFLLVIGFGYSYFWSASTIIYLLMRRKVDDAEMDEIYLEEDDQDLAYTPPVAPSVAPAAPSPGPSLTMVEPPSLRPSAAPSGEPAGVSSSANPPRTEPPSSTGPSGDGGASPGGAG
jgi:hypothetical protein